MIVNENAIIHLNQFSSMVELPDLEALAPAVDYEIVDNSNISATVISSKELLMDSLFDVEPGDSISLIIDDFPFKNIVDNIDVTKTKIILTEDITDKDGEYVESGAIEVRRTDNITLKLLDLDEGHYLIKPTNTKVVVRKSYVQPYVSLAEISAKLVDAGNLKQSRMDSVNSLALKMIYSDLSGFENYYDIIDEIDLWKILFFKIECILSADYNIKQDDYKPCARYEKLISTYKPREKFTENPDGTPSDKIDNEINVGSWTL